MVMSPELVNPAESVKDICLQKVNLELLTLLLDRHCQHHNQ